MQYVRTVFQLIHHYLPSVPCQIKDKLFFVFLLSPDVVFECKYSFFYSFFGIILGYFSN